MNKLSLFLVMTILIALPRLYASENFQAPIPAGGKLLPTDNSANVNYHYEELSLKEIKSFYKNEFKDEADINWNELKDRSRIIIYDWGNQKWHKINIIDKGHDKGLLITISKDSWTWIIGTLVIRFVGVFAVLVILMIALYISGSILSLGKEKINNEKS